MVNNFPYLYGSNLLWVVGLLEGEGCFSIGKRPGSLHIRAVMDSTDKDVVVKFGQLVGIGKVYGPRYGNISKNNKPYWSWQTTKGSDAYNLMLLILPLMSYRRSRKIEDLLSCYETNYAQAQSVIHRSKMTVEQADKMAEGRRRAILSRGGRWRL